MGYFDIFREEGWNTFYGTKREPAKVDVTEILIAYTACVLGVALIIVFLGSTGKERWCTFLRLIFNLHTGIAILLCVSGQDWAVSNVDSHCHYTSLTQKDIYANVGLKIGLKSINVTLVGKENASAGLGTIMYNEEFSYNQVHDMEEAVLDARIRGLPQVILYIVDYFGEDGGGLRWNRSLREAGHFTTIVLWTSLVAWLVGSVLISFVVTNGAVLLLITGALMELACILYHTLQPKAPLVVPLQDGYLRLRYGWCFWLCLASGLLTFLYAVGVLIFNALNPTLASEIFLVEPSVDDEDVDQKYTPASGMLQIDNSYAAQKRYSTAGVYDNAAYVGENGMPMKRVQITITDGDAPVKESGYFESEESGEGASGSDGNGSARESSGDMAAVEEVMPPPPPDYNDEDRHSGNHLSPDFAISMDGH